MVVFCFPLFIAFSHEIYSLRKTCPQSLFIQLFISVYTHGSSVILELFCSSCPRFGQWELLHVGYCGKGSSWMESECYWQVDVNTSQEFSEKGS